MKRIETEVEIAAAPERVWEVLVDFESYPDWNPFVRRIKGTPQTGERLEVRIEPPGETGMSFRPTVLRAERGRELRWIGRLLVRGLFDGEHSFTIEPLGEGRSRFRQNETFTGLLVPLFAGKLDTATRAGFEQMNRALRERAESPFNASRPGTAG